MLDDETHSTCEECVDMQHGTIKSYSHVPRIRINECDRIGALFVRLGIDVVALLEGCARVLEDVFGTEAVALHASIRAVSVLTSDLLINTSTAMLRTFDCRSSSCDCIAIFPQHCDEYSTPHGVGGSEARRCCPPARDRLAWYSSKNSKILLYAL